jgi:hypothetical protein
MKTLLQVIIALIFLTGCNFSKSVKKDLVSGLTTKGDVLTCQDVYLTVNNERTSKNVFDYGEVIYLIFNDMQGFTKENGNTFPSMDITVTDEAGDTALFAGNLYSEYAEGISLSPLQLTADLTIASPIRSGGKYNLDVFIKDKKGAGTYSSKFRFSVSHNDLIKIEPEGASADEVYLYSQGNDKVINDNKIKFDDNIYIIIEGLKGFTAKDGLIFPGLSLKGTDSEKNLILNYDDLFSEYSETGVAVSDFESRVSSHFRISGNQFSNPLDFEMIVWDKKSNSKLKVSASLKVE